LRLLKKTQIQMILKLTIRRLLTAKFDEQVQQKGTNRY
jgi:hypothetical protein